MGMMKQELERLLDLHKYELLDRARAVIFSLKLQETFGHTGLASVKLRKTYGCTGDFNRDIDRLREIVDKIYGKSGG